MESTRFFSRDGRLMSFDIGLGKLMPGNGNWDYKGMDRFVTRHPRLWMHDGVLGSIDVHHQ
jgi:hypothetical protein